MPLLRLPPRPASTGAGALSASRAVHRALCATQLRPPRGPAAALLSLRRSRVAVRAPALVTCAAADRAAVERYLAAAADIVHRSGGETDTNTLSQKLLDAGFKRPAGFTRPLYKLLKTSPETFAIEPNPSSDHWHVRLLSGEAPSPVGVPKAEKQTLDPDVEVVASEAADGQPDAFICAVVEFLRGCTNNASDGARLGEYLKAVGAKQPFAGKLTKLLKRYPLVISVSSGKGGNNLVTLVSQPTLMQSSSPMFSEPDGAVHAAMPPPKPATAQAEAAAAAADNFAHEAETAPQLPGAMGEKRFILEVAQMMKSAPAELTTSVVANLLMPLPVW